MRRSARRALVAALALSMVAVASGGRAAWAADGSLPALEAVRDGAHGPWFRGACRAPTARVAACDADVISNAEGEPLVSSTPPSGAYGPPQFHTGYDLPTDSPSEETIGIVDAYDDPDIAGDLATYDAEYGLPQMTEGAPCSVGDCFEKVDESGTTSPLPSANASWDVEISLDVETAHEICQNCNIILVEASSDSLSDLAAAANTAVSLGATVVSNSYGGAESSDETSLDSDYDHPGVPIVASAGDTPYGPDNISVSYPAASPYVTAVGGTTLKLNPDNSYGSESVWLTSPYESRKDTGEGTGSGCSLYEPKPAWQTDTGCANRMVADVAADADPATGAAVYDSTQTDGQSGWLQVGGTSLAAPLIAGVYALTGDTQADVDGETPYLDPSGLHDVTSGDNGSCSPAPAYFCTAEPGYDGPSGLGTPDGLTAFFPPDFTLAVGSSSPDQVAAGATGSYAVTVDDLGGFAGAVTLSASGLPAGVTASFAPASASTASTLTVSVPTGTVGGSYPFTVSGSSGDVTENAAATLVVVGSPGPPTGVTAALTGATSATISWTAPASDGGLPISGYTVTASPGGASATAQADASSATVDGLTPGTTYTFAVAASNSAGPGQSSTSSNAVTPPGPPGPPSGVSALAGDGEATVSWTAPASDGGLPISGYTVTASPGGETVTVPADATSATLSGLGNGTAYVFTVTALNADGASAASAPSAPVTPTAPAGDLAPAGSGSATGDSSPSSSPSSTRTLSTSTAGTSGKRATVTVSPAIAVAGGFATVKLTCMKAACKGTVELRKTVVTTTRKDDKTVTRRKTTTLGSASYSLAEGASRRIRIHLNAAGRRALAKASKRRPTAVQALVTVKGGAPRTSTASAT